MTSRLNPYISFSDSARQAMEFYRDVFGGELALNTFGELGGAAPGDENKIMHAMLETPSGFALMGSDTPAGMPRTEGSPLGPAIGSLTVADLDPASVAIVDTLGSYLPRLGADDGDQENFQAFAVVVRETTAAIAERTACIAGKNFLQVAACDVVATSAVSRAVIGQLPRRPATEMLPLVLDPTHWAEWVAPRLPEPAPGGRTLAQAAVPAPVVVVPPPVVPAAPPAVPSPAPAVPAPVPTPQLPDPPSRGFDLADWLEDALSRFRSDSNGNGNGHGNGHGGGRGDGDGRGGR